jgi:hypothetical protein
MRQVLLPIVVVSGALGMGPALVSAQDNPPRYYYQEGAPSASDFRATQTLFAAVRSDLDRAENNLPEYSASRYGFDRVRGELSELQRQWDESAYEPRQVDTVIRTLDRATRTPDLLPRDRDRLMSDLNELRDFRDGHE